MQFLRVSNSEFISAIGYDSRTSMMFVEMYEKKVNEELEGITLHAYKRVPPCVFDCGRKVLKKGGSVGVWYNSQVRNYFRGEEVELETWLRKFAA